jgi:hypothetical protein
MSGRGRFQPNHSGYRNSGKEARSANTDVACQCEAPALLVEVQPQNFQNLTFELSNIVNEQLEANHKSIVFAALRQFILARLQSSEYPDFENLVSDPCTALHNFSQHFNETVQITWPKTPGFVRFFRGCWGKKSSGGSTLSDAELSALLQECLQLSDRACAMQLAKLSKEIYEKILSALVTASYRTITARKYTLLDLLVQRSNLQSGREQLGSTKEAESRLLDDTESVHHTLRTLVYDNPLSFWLEGWEG